MRGVSACIRRVTGLALTVSLVAATLASGAVGAAYAEDAPTRFTGEPSEWAAVPHNSASSAGALLELKAVQRDGKLYLLVRGTQVSADGTFYIDADNDGTTGDSVPFWSDSAGIDYRIVGGQLYQYSGETWTSAGTADYGSSGTIAETAVDLTDLGLDGTTPVKVSYRQAAGNSFLPDPGRTMLNAEAQTDAYGPDPDLAIDADPSDWSGLEPLAQSADGLTRLYAAMNNETLSILVTGKTGEWNDIFIDIDNDKDTGFNANWLWADSGFDYLLENGDFFENVDGAFSWNPLSSDGIQYAESGPSENRVLEMSVPLSRLGLSSPTALHLGFGAGDQYAPAASAEAAKALPSLPRVTVDGSDADWAGIAPLAEGTGDLQDLSAFVKGTTLYVLARGTDLSGEKNLFVNSDSDPATGHLGWQYERTGADYLVQNGLVFESTGPGWSWNEIGVAETVVSSVYAPAGGSILEMAVDMDGWANLSSTIRVALGVGEAYAPPVQAAEYPAALSANGAAIVVDGQAEDWSAVDNKAVSSGGMLTLRAVRDEEKLFLLAEGTNLNAQNEFFIDSDGDAATGWHDSGWADSGIDYKISRNSLYRYDGGDVWTRVGSVYNRPNADSDLVYLYLSQIEATSSGPMKAAYMSKNAMALPADGAAMLTVDASVRQLREPGVYYPRESFEVLNNPYMGWAAWSRDVPDKPLGEPYAQPHSLVYAGIAWRELEPAKGEFDWAGIESKYQFDYWASQGKKINLRVVLDLPTSDPLHKDIPDWLYDELVDAETASGAGKWYETTEVGSGFAPNYNSPTLLAEHERLIRALAERYDEDPRIAFIQIGSLGHWGEFHNYPEGPSGKFPNVRVSDQYVQHYLDHFQHKLIGMRKPFPIAAEHQLGLFNDVFGDKGSTQSWLTWARDGWSDIGLYLDPDQNAAQMQAASQMPDFWKSNYSGGEFTSGNPLLSLNDHAFMESLSQARASHTSWLGPSSPADYRVGVNGVTRDVQENMDTLLKTMGYRFVLESAKHVATATRGTGLSVTTHWNNKGVAPFYMDWPVAVALADAGGQLVPSTISVSPATDIRGWLPGGSDTTLPLRIPANLAPGTYTLLIAILDPDTDEPGIRLAIEGKRPDGWYALDSIRVAASSSGSSSPSTGPGNESPNGAPDDAVQTIEKLPAADAGEVQVELQASGQEVRMPADQLFASGGSLELSHERFSVTVPAGTLEQLAALTRQNGLDEAAFYMKWQAVDPARLVSSLQAAAHAPNSRYESAGQSLVFEIGLRGKDGATIPLTSFGEPLILRLKLAAGADKKLAGLYFIPDEGEPVYIGGAAADDVMTARVSRSGDYAVLTLDRRFEDVASGHWASREIQVLAAKHALEDARNDRFEPGRRATRAEFALMLARVMGLEEKGGEPAFADVPSDSAYASAIQAVAEKGIIAGKDKERFAPRDVVTRQEAAAMLFRAYRAVRPDARTDSSGDALTKFEDRSLAAGWAIDPLQFLAERGMLQGTSPTVLDPRGEPTRAQAAALLSRWLDLPGGF
ncbi:DUF4832 domain-containing protein [Cohnella cellulosilytica]|uniref:DUF4832 domain-containing protein n=1 Tax=Cohnella cellulosilytica TaxID=986710 RepID=A0ABW2FLS2_9BACL